MRGFLRGVLLIVGGPFTLIALAIFLMLAGWIISNALLG